jgi:hypothetical protein
MWKYLVSADGINGSARLGKLLLSNSVVLKEDSSCAAKLKAFRAQMRAYKAGIAAATNSPRSHALNLQDLHEMRKGETQKKAIGKCPEEDGDCTSSRVDMTRVINKPCTFDGTTGQFHDWKNEVQIFLRIMKFSPEQEASLVQSYLRGTALAWWIQKLEQMSANGIPPPATYAELLHYLNERFDHRNPELAARDKLMSLM